MDNSILIIIPNFGKGGAERVLSRMLLSLSLQELENVTFLTLNHDLGYSLPRDLKIIRLPQKRLKSAIPSILSIIHKGRWKIIYSTLNHFNLFLPVLTLGNRNIQLICRESILPRTYYSTFGYKGRILLWYYSWIMKYYDSVIVQSQDMLSEVNSLGVRNTFLINNPSPNYSNVNTDDKDRMFDFIYVARWHDQKNHEALIKYWKWIKDEKNDNSTLLCVGVGSRAKVLNEELSSYNITFMDSNSSINEIMNNSLFYLNFSKYEGFSNSILEALSCGLPVFALDFLGGKNELLNSENSFVSNVRSFDVNESYFDSVYDDFIQFKSSDWNRTRIKKSTDDKFEITAIINKFKSVLFFPN